MMKNVFILNNEFVLAQGKIQASFTPLKIDLMHKMVKMNQKLINDTNTHIKEELKSSQTNQTILFFNFLKRNVRNHGPNVLNCILKKKKTYLNLFYIILFLVEPRTFQFPFL